MRSRYSLLLLLLLSVFHLVTAQGSNIITVPPGGFNVTAGESITLEWTDLSPSTVTIQLTPASGTGGLNLASTLPNNGRATLSIPSDVSTTQRYEFRIMDDSNSSNSHTTTPFTISPSSGSVTTSTVATSTAAAAPSSSTSSSSDPSLSSSAIAGISAGAVLGFCAIIGIAVFFIWRRRKHDKWLETQRQQQLQQQEYEQVHRHSEAAELYDEPPSNQYVPRSEMVGNKNFPREMEGTSRYQHMGVAELPAREVVDEQKKA